MNKKIKTRQIRFKTTYLEYYKNVLGKVSFCGVLFKKEYEKAKKVIPPSEMISLDRWIKESKIRKNVA